MGTDDTQHPKDTQAIKVYDHRSDDLRLFERALLEILVAPMRLSDITRTLGLTDDERRKVKKLLRRYKKAGLVTYSDGKVWQRTADGACYLEQLPLPAPTPPIAAAGDLYSEFKAVDVRSGLVMWVRLCADRYHDFAKNLQDPSWCRYREAYDEKVMWAEGVIRSAEPFTPATATELDRIVRDLDNTLVEHTGLATLPAIIAGRKAELAELDRKVSGLDSRRRLLEAAIGALEDQVGMSASDFHDNIARLEGSGISLGRLQMFVQLIREAEQRGLGVSTLLDHYEANMDAFLDSIHLQGKVVLLKANVTGLKSDMIDTNARLHLLDIEVKNREFRLQLLEGKIDRLKWK